MHGCFRFLRSFQQSQASAHRARRPKAQSLAAGGRRRLQLLLPGRRVADECCRAGACCQLPDAVRLLQISTSISRSLARARITKLCQCRTVQPPHPVYSEKQTDAACSATFASKGTHRPAEAHGAAAAKRDVGVVLVAGRQQPSRYAKPAARPAITTLSKAIEQPSTHAIDALAETAAPLPSFRTAQVQV